MNLSRNWISVLFFLAFGTAYAKTTKEIAVFEPIDTSDPWTSIHMKSDYTSAAEIALQHFIEDGASYHPKLNYFFIDDTPLEKVHCQIKESNSLGMIGNVFIYESLSSKKYAEANSITYINPMCSGDFLFTDGYSKSMGTPAEREIEASVNFIKSNIEYSDIFILYRCNVGYDLYYKYRFLQKFPEANLIRGLQHDEMVIDEIIKSKRPLIIVASQAHNMVKAINDIHVQNKESIFFGTNQWGHVDNFFRPTLKNRKNIRLYAASDYLHLTKESISHLDSKFHLNKSLSKAERFRGDFKKQNGREPAAFGHLVYDSVTLSLNVMNDPSVSTREDFLIKINSVKDFSGVTSNFKLVNGKIEKAGYILEWKDRNFVPVKEF